MQPRVIHVISGDLWGGAEALTSRLIQEQASLAPNSVSAFVMNPGRLSSEIQRYSVPLITVDESQESVARILKKLILAIRKNRPHVLHSHRHKENVLTAISGRLAGVRSMPKLVTTVHGLPEPFARQQTLKNHIGQQFNRAMLRNLFDAVVAVSNELSDQLQKSVTAERLFCIHNGIHIRSAEVCNSSNEMLHFVALGRLVPIKRYDRLPSFKQLVERKLGARVRITLAGDGPLRDQLRRQYEAEGAPEIAMMGFINDVDGLLASADGLLITSDHEGLPMAALEALNFGRPVFGFRVGGLSELQSNGAPVSLADPYDIDDLATRVATYFSTPSPLWRPTKDWEFSIEKCARSYLDLYSALAFKESQPLPRKSRTDQGA